MGWTRRASWSMFAGAWLAMPALASGQQESAPQPPAWQAVMAGGRGYVFVPPPDGTVAPPGVAAAPPSRILYINDCKPDGCVIVGGDVDDSRIDQSAIVEGTRTLAPYAGSAAMWDAMVACVRENYAPFQIRVVTEDPGDVPHYEAFAAGHPGDIGFPLALGVASRWCSTFPNAVSFSFLNFEHNDADEMCWTVSQESAHNFGLSHTMLADDAMTYRPLPRRKRFINQNDCIGTQGCCQPAFECMCGLFEQNSYQRLLQTFGPAGATAPDIFIDEPGNGAIVRPGFPVRATVEDWDGVALVELLVDEVVHDRRTAPPFDFVAPAELAAGAHTVTIRAIDGTDLMGRVNITVTVDPPCTSDAWCDAVGNGLACVDGECVPAPVADGGCSGGGAGGGGALAAIAAGLVAMLRRRRG